MANFEHGNWSFRRWIIRITIIIMKKKCCRNRDLGEIGLLEVRRKTTDSDRYALAGEKAIDP